MAQQDNVSLRTFVTELADKAMAYGQKLLVLRNYQHLPDGNMGEDIDILIPSKNIEQWNAIVAETHNVLDLDYETPLVLNYCCHKQVVHGLPSRNLELDLEPHLNWRGVDWIDVDEVIERSIPYRKNIWIPHPADECVISFCMSYLYGGFVKEKYLPLMSQQARANREEVFGLLKKIFGRKTANEILDGLINQDIAYISQKATVNRLKVLWRGFLRYPLRFVYTLSLGYLIELRNKFNYDNQKVQANN